VGHGGRRKVEDGGKERRRGGGWKIGERLFPKEGHPPRGREAMKRYSEGKIRKAARKRASIVVQQGGNSTLPWRTGKLMESVVLTQEKRTFYRRWGL